MKALPKIYTSNVPEMHLYTTCISDISLVHIWLLFSTWKLSLDSTPSELEAATCSEECQETSCTPPAIPQRWDFSEVTRLATRPLKQQSVTQGHVTLPGPRKASRPGLLITWEC